MQIPGRTARTKSVAASPRGGSVDFADYTWDVDNVAGWASAVCLFAEESATKAGDPMLVVTFGVDPRDPTALGGRLKHFVPVAFADRLGELLAALAPDLAAGEDDFVLDPKALRFKRCGVLITEDTTYDRRDGRTSWRARKVVPLAKLPADWREAEYASGAQAQAQDEDEDEDLF